MICMAEAGAAGLLPLWGMAEGGDRPPTSIALNPSHWSYCRNISRGNVNVEIPGVNSIGGEGRSYLLEL